MVFMLIKDEKLELWIGQNKPIETNRSLHNWLKHVPLSIGQERVFKFGPVKVWGLRIKKSLKVHGVFTASPALGEMSETAFSFSISWASASANGTFHITKVLHSDWIQIKGHFKGLIKLWATGNLQEQNDGDYCPGAGGTLAGWKKRFLWQITERS